MSLKIETRYDVKKERSKINENEIITIIFISIYPLFIFYIIICLFMYCICGLDCLPFDLVYHLCHLFLSDEDAMYCHLGTDCREPGPKDENEVSVSVRLVP